MMFSRYDRQRRVHEELRRHRGFVRIAREQVRVLEDEMLVHVEMKVGRAPGQTVEAERAAESGRGGEPQRAPMRRLRS